MIDVDVFILFLRLRLFQQLKVDLHALLDAVVRDRPSRDDSVVYFTFFDPDYELL